MTKGVMSLQPTPMLNPDAPVFCPGEVYNNCVSRNSSILICTNEPNMNLFSSKCPKTCGDNGSLKVREFSALSTSLSNLEPLFADISSVAHNYTSKIKFIIGT